MRWVVVTILAGALLLGNESAALANKDKVPCKKIKEAIASGKTAEQAATELGAKPKRVENCMSGKKKAQKAAAAGQAPGATGASADDEDGED